MPLVGNVVAGDTGIDLSDLINAQAAQNELPPELLVALGIAESELTARSERWGRHSAEARAALAAGDSAALERIVAQIEAETPNDISFGLFQQTVRFAGEGDHSDSLANILAVRDVYFDPVHATMVAARTLGIHYRRFGDRLEALCRYNAPSRRGVDNPNRPRYQESLSRAQAFVVPAGGTGGAVAVLSPFPVDDRPSPNLEPHRPRTIGVFIHSTRGPTNTLEADYQATINAFLDPAFEASAHL